MSPDAPSQNETASMRRGLGGILMLVVPIVSVAIVGTTYAVLVSYGVAGREATGASVVATYAACPEAAPVLQARVEAMGLPGVSVETHTTDGTPTVALSMVLPEDPEVAAAIPRDLARPGSFEVQPEATPDQPLATRADLAAVQISLAFFDTPKTTVQLGPDATKAVGDHMDRNPEGSVLLAVDGTVIGQQKNMPPEKNGVFTLDLRDVSDRDRMNWAAATAIVLEHGPLPCPVTLQDVTPQP